MAYRIVQGQLCRQSVAGGRWELVDRKEEERVLSLASEIAKTDPVLRAIHCAEARQAEPA